MRMYSYSVFFSSSLNYFSNSKYCFFKVSSSFYIFYKDKIND